MHGGSITKAKSTASSLLSIVRHLKTVALELYELQDLAMSTAELTSGSEEAKANLSRG
jgi:hypothetical protein